MNINKTQVFHRNAQTAAGWSERAAPEKATTLYCLFGFDVMVDGRGRAVLIECNAFPALASGTMREVPPAVYTELVCDTVRTAVLPVTDGLPPELGGYVDLNL
eukprot:6963846-Pyramimonas_sp.AAC.1